MDHAPITDVSRRIRLGTGAAGIERMETHFSGKPFCTTATTTTTAAAAATAIATLSLRPRPRPPFSANSDKHTSSSADATRA